MTPHYRKIPGKRRGFFNVSSVWAGPDHLLLVRGSRFREEYKRFYYRDVQAIAVARAPRFHISTRAAAVGVACWAALSLASLLLAPLLGRSFSTWAGLIGLGLSGVVLASIWALVSGKASCRCRIYTAVSSDELPSVYRVWTAKRFLAEVEPLIARTQGAIQGEWAAAAEVRTVGPAAAASPGTAQPGPALPRRSLVSDLFLASLFTDVLAKLFEFPAHLARWLPVAVAVELIAVAAAVAVLVQYNRGRLRAGMHKVAIASLLAFGALYYVQSMSAGISATMTAARTGKRTTAMAFPQSRLGQEVGAGIDAILLIVGFVVSLRKDEYRPWN